MPIYDYQCPSCSHEQEEFHSMSSEPEVHCEECDTTMTKVIKLGHGGFKLVKDSTRRRDYGTRYGGKHNKSDHTPTPSESAEAKAAALSAEKKAKKKNPSDPYASFR